MAFNVPEKDRPEFNKLVREELYDVLNNVQRRAFETVVEESRDPFIDAFNNIEQLPSEGADNIYDAVFNEVQQAPLVAVEAEKKPSYADSIRRKDIPPGGDPKDFIITDPKEILSTPLYEDKVRLLGLVDENYKVTDFGRKFSNLMEAGIFDENGVLTPKGRAYSLSDMELRDPANIKEFSILWEDEVIRESASAGEILGGVGNFLKEAALGVVELAPILAQNAYYQFDNRKGFGIPFFRPSNQDNRPQSLKDKTIAAATSTAETWTKNFIELKGLADVGVNLYNRSVGKDPFSGLDQELDAETYFDLQRARQRQWSDREMLGDMEVGEVAETILSIEGAVAEAQEVKKRMGEEEFNKVYGRVGSTMQIASPENAIPGVAAFNFAKGPALASRLSLLAQKTVGTALEIQQTAARASLALAENQNIITKNALVQERANRIIAQGGANAPRAKEILDFSNKATRKAQELIPDLTKTIESSTQQAAKLSSRIPVAAAEATLKVTQVGRNLRAMPAKAVGTTLEGFGNTLTKVDDAVSGFLKERGLNQAYAAAVGAAGVVGLAGSPVIGAVAGGAAILKAGKFISNYGKFFKYVGKEMAKVRGQIPFWKRVAAHTAPGSLNRGIAHTFNMLDLSGVTSDVLRRTGRGVAAAYPVDLMFEYLSDGGDMRPQTFLQAGAESLVIGGSFAAAGGAFMGTEKRMRELSIGDQLNLVQGMTDDRQKALYYTLPSGVRSAVATYGIANPTLIYNFKDSGSSEYDPNSNTASINVKSNNPIRPLIAHETLHHTIVKNNMEGGIAALFLGDTINNTVGGLLRSRDGKLDPNFEAFRDRYYQRLNIAGMTDAEKNAIYPLEKVAVEYFIEQHSDQYAEMAESGELGAIAASGDIKRKLSGVLETVLPRIPVLRDLHFKSGGMIDKDGGWVTGNGILDAEGVRTNPITNKMFRDMNRRSSGRSPGQFDPLMSDKQDSGAQITLDPTKTIDSELLHPLVKVDENGRPVLVNGQPVALDKATLLERALAGLTAKEVLRRKKAENYIPEKGEAYIDELGEYVPGWLSNNVLSEMFAKNRFNPEQKRIIREVNRMIREGNGGRAVMINFPATTRNKSGKAVYKPQGATLRDTVPVAITISKDGNLLFGLMSVTKLQENIKKRSQSRLGKKLYGGNVDLILRDTQAMMQFHKDGVDSIEYFKSKYGAVEADERKKFINTMFGLLNKSEQAVLNPMLIEDGVKSKDNVYRTYRADRVSKAVAMSPEDYPAMPFSYEAVSQVKMPEQARQMPEKRLATGQDTEQEAPSNERQPSTIQAQPSRASTGGSEATGEGLRGQGGLSGGSQQLQSHGRPGDQSVPLIGLPATVKVPGIGKYTFGPNEVARNVAAEYARSVGIDYDPPKTYAKVDAARATRIADEYDKMVHAPNDPRVKESYDAMIKETIDQWEAIKKTGLIVEPIPAGAKNPYAASPRLAIIDVKDNNHLWFFPTNSGFGGTESAGIDVSGNPLMNPTGEILNGHTMLANDVFRIVHDYFGHIKEGVGFRADGEENAWRSHSAMYSDKARPAMTAETRGQNSWVNYGPFAEFNKTADADNTQYAPQKTGLLSDWVMGEGAGDVRYMPEGYKSHHDETLLNSAWDGEELNPTRPFKANESLPSLAMRTRWEEKPLVDKNDFDFTEKARVTIGKNKNGEDVTIKFDPNLLNTPNIVDFLKVYLGEQIQYTIADRMSAVDGDMGGALHSFLKNNDIVIEGPDGKQYVIAWGNNSTTVGTKMRRKAKDGAEVLMVYLMGVDAHQSNTRTVRLFDTQLENSSMPSHMVDITRAYSYIPIKEIKHASLLKEVFKINQAIQKAQKLKKDSSYIDELKNRKQIASKEASKFKVSEYDKELAGIFRKLKSSQTRFNNGNGKQSTVDANINELSKFATSVKGGKVIKEMPSKFIYDMTKTFDGRKFAVSQIANLSLYDFDGAALSSATADMMTADKNAIVAAIDLSKNQDFFMLYMGNDPKQINAMTISEKAAAAKLKQNENFVVHEAYDTLILSPLDGRRNLNSRMENALDAVPDSFQSVLDDRPSVKAQVGKTDAKGNPVLSEDNLLNTVRDQQSIPLIYNPIK